MDSSLSKRVKQTIFNFKVNIEEKGERDGVYTLDYERGRYRQRELVGLIRDSAPYFSLTSDEINNIEPSERNRRAFYRISEANEKSKGDYGELLLFLILSIFYEVPKFVTKARLRSTNREQIKGFDCAHFSKDDNGIILWLGEAKFHKTISGAVSSASQSLSEHFGDVERVKSELRLLGGEIEINKDMEPELYEELESYTLGNQSLDKVRISIPVLLTYDSSTIKYFCGDESSDIESEPFYKKMCLEVEKHFGKIQSKKWPNHKTIDVCFFLVPLECVETLKKEIALIEAAMRF